jgi:hypothetical protein
LAGRRADVLDIREVIRRVQLGEADRQIARDLQVSRKTVGKYRAWAQQHEVLAGPLPDAATLQVQLQMTLPVSPPPTVPSKVAPFRDQVIALRQRGVECRAIFDILREPHAFAGSYGAVYRFVRHLEPRTPDVGIPAKMNARSGDCERRFRAKPYTHRSEATTTAGLVILLRSAASSYGLCSVHQSE